MLEKVIEAKFFKTSSGKEPAREWLKNLPKDDKKAIGMDINAIEKTWPIGFPLVAKLDANLWEIRTNLRTGISRVFFTIFEKDMILLHGIIKKSQKTPKADLDLSKRRRNIVLTGGKDNEK